MSAANIGQRSQQRWAEEWEADDWLNGESINQSIEWTMLLSFIIEKKIAILIYVIKTECIHFFDTLK